MQIVSKLFKKQKCIRIHFMFPVCCFIHSKNFCSSALYTHEHIAKTMGLEEKVVQRLIAGLHTVFPKLQQLIKDSFLSEEQKQAIFPSHFKIGFNEEGN